MSPSSPFLRTRKPPGSLNIGTVTAGVYGARNFRGPFTAASVSALPFALPAAGTQLTSSMLRELERHGVVPSRGIVGFSPITTYASDSCVAGKGVTFSVQSVIDSHRRARATAFVVSHAESWERRLYINPRVEPASATAVASFVTRALNFSSRPGDEGDSLQPLMLPGGARSLRSPTHVTNA